MFVVIKTHNFDPEYEALQFATETSAKAYLHYAWEEYLNTEIAETEGNVDTERSYHEDDYGCIYWNGNEDVTEFRLMELQWGLNRDTMKKIYPYIPQYKQHEKED